jgi:hypothetical protein
MLTIIVRPWAVSAPLLFAFCRHLSLSDRLFQVLQLTWCIRFAPLPYLLHVPSVSCFVIWEPLTVCAEERQGWRKKWAIPLCSVWIFMEACRVNFTFTGTFSPHRENENDRSLSGIWTSVGPIINESSTNPMCKMEDGFDPPPLPSVQTGCEVHSACCLMGTGAGLSTHLHVVTRGAIPPDPHAS